MMRDVRVRKKEKIASEVGGRVRLGSPCPFNARRDRGVFDEGEQAAIRRHATYLRTPIITVAGLRTYLS